MIEKYNVPKTIKELKAIAKESNTKCNATIFLIANELRLYNSLVDMYNGGNDAKGYTIYQISTAIFKHLQAFNLCPIRLKEEPKEETTYLSEVMAKVNQIK